jgi:hypothetical protein
VESAITRVCSVSSGVDRPHKGKESFAQCLKDKNFAKQKRTNKGCSGEKGLHM